jgi:hypothetical protein
MFNVKEYSDMATQPGRHKQFSWIRWIIIVIAVLLFASSAVIWILQGIIFGHLSTVVSIIFAVTGVIVALIQWFFPYSSSGIHDEAVVEVGRRSRTAPEEFKGLSAFSAVQVDQETPATGPTWNVPFRRNPFFTGREDLLKQLHDNLTKNKAAALTQAQAISGLGGIGKTQTAVEYAYRHRDEYRCVLWINAATRDALIADFVDLVTLLHLPERQEQDQQKVVAAVKQWLSTHDQWLLIFDNADDLSLAEEFLPTGGNGHLLLTTRAYAPGTLANGIEVEELDLQEGMLLLLRRAGVLARDASLDQAPVSDRTAAAAIVEELGGLPLALDQAGAYIEETRCSVADYLQSYRQRQAALLKRRGGDG